MQKTPVSDLVFDFSTTEFIAATHDLNSLAARYLFTWQIAPLPLWSRGVSSPESSKFVDELFLDTICKDICHLPTVVAMIETYPEMKEYPIFARHYDAEGDGKKFGEFRRFARHIHINAEHPHLNSNIAGRKPTLVHELRHGAQELSGCFDFMGNILLAADYRYQLAFRRLIEADATVLGITVAYECLLINGDGEPLKQLMIYREASTSAYKRAVQKDPEAHWDGRAANAAFKAYLDKGNQPVLDVYDNGLCKQFSDGCGSGKVPDTATERLKRRIFSEGMAPMTRMPFIDKTGHMEERPHYLDGISLTPRTLIKNLSPDIKRRLTGAPAPDLSAN